MHESRALVSLLLQAGFRRLPNLRLLLRLHVVSRSREHLQAFPGPCARTVSQPCDSHNNTTYIDFIKYCFDNASMN